MPVPGARSSSAAAAAEVDLLWLLRVDDGQHRVLFHRASERGDGVGVWDGGGRARGACFEEERGRWVGGFLLLGFRKEGRKGASSFDVCTYVCT